MNVKENKTYARTVRMKESIRRYVEEQPGENFSDKFENMVLYAMRKEAQIKKAVAQGEQQLAAINQAIVEKQTLRNRLNEIDRYIASAQSLCK